MRKIYLLLPLIFVLNSCATPGALKTLDIKDNEAIIIGYLDVNYNNEMITYNSKLFFYPQKYNNTFLTKYGYGVNFKQTSFLVARLPIGTYYINYVNCIPHKAKKEVFHKMNKEETVFTLDKSGIFYIGHIHINWNGPEYKWNTYVPEALLEKAVYQAFKLFPDHSNDELTIKVSDRLDEILSNLKNEYPNLGEIKKKILLIK